MKRYEEIYASIFMQKCLISFVEFKELEERAVVKNLLLQLHKHHGTPIFELAMLSDSRNAKY